MNRDCEYLTLGVSFFHFRGIPLMYYVIKKDTQTDTHIHGRCTHADRHVDCLMNDITLATIMKQIHNMECKVCIEAAQL